MKVVVFGASGFAGRVLTAELDRRGHEVVPVARTQGDESPQVVPGSALDAAFVASVASNADVLVSALPALIGDEAKIGDALAVLLKVAESSGARLGVVGAGGNLVIDDEGSLLVSVPGFPDYLKPVVAAHAEALALLASSSTDVDWFYCTPPAGFDPANPGERVGSYRKGGTRMLVGEDGNSYISGPDFALAFVDELESPSVRRDRFTVGY